MRIKRGVVAAVIVLASATLAPATASAGPNDLIGDEESGCASGANRHSGELEVQAFLTQQVISNFNWCKVDGRVTWWQRPAINISSNLPFSGAFEKISVENLTNIAAERIGDGTAIYTFSLLQEIVRPTGASQRHTMTLRIDAPVGMTSLCMGKTCDRNTE